MKEKEELSAYEVLRLDPYRYLAMPRYFAFLTMIPCLTAISNALALVGGWIVCVLALVAACAFAEEYVILDGENFEEEPAETCKYDTPSLPIVEEHLLEGMDNSYSWRQCGSIGRYGTVCGQISIYPSTLTIYGTVTWNGHKVYTYKYSAGTICAHEKDLLKLVSYVPALEEFKPVIDEVVKIMGYIPGYVFSVCLHLYNIKWANHHLSACASVGVTLVCWRGKCAWKGSKGLGCFKI